MKKETSNIKADVLLRVNIFLRESKMTEWKFGMEVCGNHKLLQNLRSNKPIKSTTIDKILDFING